MKKISEMTQEQNTATPLSAELLKSADEREKEEVVIPDECGDTLWCAVLAQEDKAAQPDNAVQAKSADQIKE